MAAMVVAPNAIRLVSNTISRSFTASQTTTRRSRHGQSFWAWTPVSRISWSDRMLRSLGTASSSTTSYAAFSFRRVTKKISSVVHLKEQSVVVIPAIHRHDGAGVESEGVGHLDITASGFGDQHVARQVIVVVQQDVRLDAALGPAKLGPREQLQAQRNSGRVEREQLVLEPELLLARSQPFFVAEPVERGVEQVLVQLGGPVFVGIGKSGFIGGLGDAEMNQLAQATAQAIADLA